MKISFTPALTLIITEGPVAFCLKQKIRQDTEPIFQGSSGFLKEV